MTKENIIMKIRPNYREYLGKAIMGIIPLSIALIGVLIGIVALMNCTEEEMLISWGVFIISIALATVFAGRFLAFYIRSNKAKTTQINITAERIFGVNSGKRINVELSAVLSIGIEEASTDVDANGKPRTQKTDAFAKMCALNSKYLTIRTNDGECIYIDCIDSPEGTKNTIDSIIARNMATRQERG